MTKITVITSGKGGVGKTNVSVNTAVELARRQYKTCLFDADLGLANANILLGIHPTKTLEDYIFHEAPLEDIVLSTDYGFDLLPGSSGIEDMANLRPSKISQLLDDFTKLPEYDHFIIDTSSGISKGVISFCLAAEQTILVITAEATSLTDAYALLKVLSLNGYSGTVKVLVNKCTSIPKSKETYRHFKSVADKHLKIDLSPVGAVIFDENLEKAVSRQQPVLALYPETIASQCIRAMAINLIGPESDNRESFDFGTFWTLYFNHIFGAQAPEKNRSAAVPGHDDNSRHHEVPAHQNSSPDFPTLRSPTHLFLSGLKLHNSGQLTKEALESIICCDPVLTLNLIKLYKVSCGFRAVTTNTIPSMIRSLGEEVVRRWFLDCAVQAALSDTQGGDSQFLLKFWAHSYSCALLAKTFAEVIGYPALEEAYLAGLLHNIGRLVFELSAPELYILSPEISDENATLLQAELEFFSKNHAQFGAQLLEQFNLSSFIVDCARYHLMEEDAITTALPLTRIVYAASRLSLVSETDNNPEFLGKLLGIPGSVILDNKNRVKKELGEKAARFDISLDVTGSAIMPDSLDNTLKHEAMEHTMIQAVLPRIIPGPANPIDLQWFYTGIALLYNHDRTLCFLYDSIGNHLKVAGHPLCLETTSSADIYFETNLQGSMIVQSFKLQEISETPLNQLSNLAEKQLLQAIGGEFLHCIPLIGLGAPSPTGVLALGTRGHETETISKNLPRIQNFALQAAQFLPKPQQ